MDWLGLVAIIIAVPSAAVAVLSYLSSRGAIRQEQEDRKEELKLMREQIENQREDRLAERAARLIAVQGSSSGGERVDEYQFYVENSGPFVAHELVAMVVDPSGRKVAEASQWPALNVDKKWPFTLQIPRADSRRGGLKLKVRWEDGTGIREEILAPITPVSRLP